MNDNDRELLEGLRSLATDGQSGAPSRVEERVMREFRRRVRVRRITQWTSAAAIIAVAAALFVLVRLAPVTNAPNSVNSAVADVPAFIEVPNPTGELSMNFYELPQARELPPVENATIVRVELPVSSLRSMGFQVNEEGGNEPVQADVLLGQDGMARGVRFLD